AQTIFNRAMRAEQVHAGNYADVLANLGDAAYLNTKYATVYRCIVCGEVVTERPARCPICNASGDSFVMYNGTYFNLYAAVQGETNANAAYLAFAAKAQAEGYPAVARLFLATADAEAKHAADEWEILEGMGATEHPVAAEPSVGTTAENLQAAFDGETYEYTVMYPDFLAVAQAEGMTAAQTIFNRAMRAEQVHAGNYGDVLANLDNANYLNSKYAILFRCIVCGEVVTERPARCPICGAAGDSFVVYRDGPVLLSLSTNAESDISGDVVYTLSLKGAENVLDIEVEFTVDGSLLAGKGVVAESGFSTISDIAWSYAGGNLWIGKTTLAYKSGGELTGFDSEPSADVAKFVFSPRAAGIATMSLKNIRVAGFDAEADLVVDFDYILLAGEATTIIDQFIFSKYDLNKDNKIDALDLGIMLLYCGFSEDSPGWDSYVKVNDTKGKGVTASMCDVNGDGIIDMLDLLDLFIHYTK
ncbi:MAG: dockerin type I domain-containing protein, partial [Clostridiales bacterium]|nr:dockerin type I domain-containing protein [Clostridiales bacterium]